MRKHRWAVLTGVLLLGAEVGVAAAQAPPGAEVYPARTALGFNPVARCPDLRIADDGPAASVVFMVSPFGAPSRVSIRSPSDIEGLDAAAVKCVQKLRFQPATRTGDGVPVESWQQIAWRWAQPSGRPDDPLAMARPSPAPPAPDAREMPATGAAAGGRSGAKPDSTTHDGRVELRVCVDEAGKLTQDPILIRSSGDPRLDEAAMRVARSGSGNYRPAATVGGKPIADCLQLALRFEKK